MYTKLHIRILLCISVFFLIKPSFSQFGIKAGIGGADIIFSKDGQAPYLGYEVDYLTHQLPALSYQIVGFSTIRLNNKFDFQPELGLIKQGINYNISFPYDDVVYMLDIWYLQIPLLINCKFALNKKHQPLLFLGPYGSFMLNARRTTEYNGNRLEETMPNVKSYDMGIVGGFGYNFNLEKGQITGEFRISYGLVNMMEYTDGHLSDFEKPFVERARNVNLSLIVGYRFMSHKKKTETP